jgi:hypothetical protein
VEQKPAGVFFYDKELTINNRPEQVLAAMKLLHDGSYLLKDDASIATLIKAAINNHANPLDLANSFIELQDNKISLTIEIIAYLSGVAKPKVSVEALKKLSKSEILNPDSLEFIAKTSNLDKACHILRRFKSFNIPNKYRDKTMAYQASYFEFILFLTLLGELKKADLLEQCFDLTCGLTQATVSSLYPINSLVELKILTYDLFVTLINFENPASLIEACTLLAERNMLNEKILGYLVEHKYPAQLAKSFIRLSDDAIFNDINIPILCRSNKPLEVSRALAVIKSESIDFDSAILVEAIDPLSYTLARKSLCTDIIARQKVLTIVPDFDTQLVSNPQPLELVYAIKYLIRAGLSHEESINTCLNINDIQALECILSHLKDAKLLTETYARACLKQPYLSQLKRLISNLTFASLFSSTKACPETENNLRALLNHPSLIDLPQFFQNGRIYLNQALFDFMLSIDTYNIAKKIATNGKIQTETVLGLLNLICFAPSATNIELSDIQIAQAMLLALSSHKEPDALLMAYYELKKNKVAFTSATIKLCADHVNPKDFYKNMTEKIRAGEYNPKQMLSDCKGTLFGIKDIDMTAENTVAEANTHRSSL